MSVINELLSLFNFFSNMNIYIFVKYFYKPYSTMFENNLETN